MKDQLYEADMLPLSLFILLKCMDEDDHHNCLTLFDDRQEGERSSIGSLSILRMRVEKGEVLWFKDRV